MKSKPMSFDKSGAWPIHVNFQPRLQTPVPLGAGSLREKIFHSYRIVYRIKPGIIEIVAIVHGARLLHDIKK
jgi:plasmid stabilization system protein ParE